MTRNNASSLSGLTGAVCRKASSPVYPQVGHFFCNLPDASDAANTPQPISSSSDPLTIHLKELCRAMSSGLESLQLKAQPLYRTASHEPINLYHKVINKYIFTCKGICVLQSIDGLEVHQLPTPAAKQGSSALDRLLSLSMQSALLVLATEIILDTCPIRWVTEHWTCTSLVRARRARK